MSCQWCNVKEPGLVGPQRPLFSLRNPSLSGGPSCWSACPLGPVAPTARRQMGECARRFPFLHRRGEGRTCDADKHPSPASPPYYVPTGALRLRRWVRVTTQTKSSGQAHSTLRELFSGPKSDWHDVTLPGVDHLLFPELIKSPVPVSNAKGIFSQTLAEYAILAMAYFAKVRKDKPRRGTRQEVGGVSGFCSRGFECGVLEGLTQCGAFVA